MRDIDRPLHYSEITKLYRNHFGDVITGYSDIEHAVHSRIGDSKDFIIVDKGTFMLIEKFKVPENIEEIVKVSREILKKLGNISDTRYLIKEIKKRGISIGNLNAYSLKPILLEDPAFIKYRKFEIGVEEFADKYERKTLAELIFEVISSVKEPMHVKTIWKEISKQRGFPEYAVAQRLDKDLKFIRTGPATYTVSNNIAQYEEKRKIIINFTKEWIQLKGNAVSAFFVSEVLQSTEEIKDLSSGLVEHVLSTSPEFIRLPNGFYDLSNKEDLRTI